MKSIEELINQLECYPVSPSTLPMSVMIVTSEDINDAISYLKEYRTYIDKMEKLYHDANTELNLLKDEDWKDRNLPLTWDELRQMEGKPIWTEYNLHLSDKDARSRSRMWIIVQKIMPWQQDDELIYYSGFVFGKKEVGKSWQAYRKERK